MSWMYRSNRVMVNAAMRRAEAATLDVGLAEVVAAAKSNIVDMGAVATGALYDSVESTKMDSENGEVTATAPYAAAVHDGTLHMAPRPFLAQAASDVSGGLVQKAATEFRRAM